MKTQFITDAHGNKLAVILSMKDYQKMLDDLEEMEDIKLYDEVKARKEDTLPFNEYLKKRKKKMLEYKLIISKTAQKRLDKLPDNIAEPLIDAIKALPLTQGLTDVKNSKDGMVIASARAHRGLFMMFMTISSPLKSLPCL